MKAEREISNTLKTAVDIAFFPLKEIFGFVGEANKKAFQMMISSRIHEATISYLRRSRRH